MRRSLRDASSDSSSISRWWTAISFSQSRRFSYICLRKASASWLSGSSSRIVSKALMASAWFENFSRNRFATRRCSATFSAVSSTAAFLRSSEIRSGQRFMVSYCAARRSPPRRCRLDVQDLVEGVHHHHVQLETVAVDLDHLDQHRDLVLGRGPAGLVDRVLHHLDEGVPALRLLVDARSRRRCPRGGRGGDNLLPGVDPLFDRQLLGLQRRGGLRSLASGPALAMPCRG